MKEKNREVDELLTNQSRLNLINTLHYQTAKNPSTCQVKSKTKRVTFRHRIQTFKIDLAKKTERITKFANDTAQELKKRGR